MIANNTRNGGQKMRWLGIKKSKDGWLVLVVLAVSKRKMMNKRKMMSKRKMMGKRKMIS